MYYDGGCCYNFSASAQFPMVLFKILGIISNLQGGITSYEP